MRRSTATLAGLTVAGVAAIGFGLPALANTDEPESPSTSSSAEAERDTDREERHAERRAELAERLADELGLDAETVEEALTTVTEELRAEHREERLANLQERLDEAVAEGRITQERADELLAAAESGELRGGRGGHGMRGGHGGPGGGLRGELGQTPGDSAEDGSADGSTTFYLS